MRLIYAPALREKTDIIHANCLVSYDIQILETILSNIAGGGAECLYLPHKETPKEYNKIILDSLKQYNLKQINTLKDCNAIITDDIQLTINFISNFKKPCIFTINTYMPNIYNLLSNIPQNLIYYAYSLEKITKAIEQIK